MSMMKEVKALEENIFDMIEILYDARTYQSREDFNMALAVIEEMNDEYKEITKEYCIPQKQMIKFHEMKWEILSGRKSGKKQ